MTKEEIRKLPKDFSKVFATGIDLCNVRILFAYKNMKSEVDVSKIVEEALIKGIKVVYPEDDPYCFMGVTIKDVNVPAIMLVPGVAFTKAGKRLGRGGGFYDRTLSVAPQCIRIIGICKKSQLLDDLPTEPHDKTVQEVLAY